VLAQHVLRSLSMKKAKKSPLALNKETLSNLRLSEVVGGWGIIMPSYPNCGSGIQTCTENAYCYRCR
jgi:hypothetical protein